MTDLALIPKPIETESSNWRAEKQRLEGENRQLRRDLEDAERDKERLTRNIANLRAILTPLHRGLRAIFGEIELAVGEESPSATQSSTIAQPSGGDPRWESYKKTFPGVPAEIIDALLIHGQMRVTNLIGLLKRAHGTVYNAGDKLAKAGAISRNGGTWALNR